MRVNYLLEYEIGRRAKQVKKQRVSDSLQGEHQKLVLYANVI